MALAIILAAMLCRSVAMLRIVSCWQPESRCTCLSCLRHSKQLGCVDMLYIKACFGVYKVPVLYFSTLHFCWKDIVVPEGGACFCIRRAQKFCQGLGNIPIPLMDLPGSVAGAYGL